MCDICGVRVIATDDWQERTGRCLFCVLHVAGPVHPTEGDRPGT